MLKIIETILEWAKIMTWKGINPFIQLVGTAYQKGVRLTKKEINALANRIDRGVFLPKYHVIIRAHA